MSQYSSSDSPAIGCKCGVTISINYVKQTCHNEPEEFNCPVCGRAHSVLASQTIRSTSIKLDDEAFKIENMIAIKSVITTHKITIDALSVELGGLDSRHETLDEAEIRHAKDLQNQIINLESEVAKLKVLLAKF